MTGRGDEPIGRAIDDELRVHIEERTAELVAAGQSVEAATAQAHREFGDLEAARIELRRIDEGAARRTSFWFRIEGLRRDIAGAVRLLIRQPAFTLVATLTLALGIGASTAIFSVVNAVLLRPLPYPDAERLVLLWGDLRARQTYDFPTSAGDLPDIRRGAPLLGDLTAAAPASLAIVDEGGEPAQIQTIGVLPNFFRLLGGRIVLGRDFVDHDADVTSTGVAGADTPNQPLTVQQSSLPQIVVLSHEFWVARYGADPGVIGRTVQLSGQRSEIVGVLAPGFQLLLPAAARTPSAPSLYTALRVDFENASRTISFLRVIARLDHADSIGAAQAQLDSVAADLRARFQVKQGSDWHFRLEPMHDDLVADTRPTVLALMGAVLFVLIIACANVGNLLLVRAAARGREMAVRMALGASRLQLVRQVVAECGILALAGATLGVGAAAAATRALVMFAPAGLPRVGEVRIDLTVLAFTVTLALLSSLLCGVVPAVRASQPVVSDVLRARGSTGSLRHGRALKNGVVIVEVALSFVLLVASGLMLRSLGALRTVDPGFDGQGLMTALVVPPPLPTNEARLAFKRSLQERFSAIPGVTSVTAASPLPLDGTIQSLRWGPEAAASDSSLFQQADVHFVLPGYFEAMRTPLLRGRVFTADDNRPEATVIVIDEAFAARAFGDEDPIGRRILARVRTSDPETFTVIGVVKHQYQSGLASPGREAVFLADGVVGHGSANRWALRTSGDPRVLASDVIAAVKALAPLVPVSQIQPMSVLRERAMDETRFTLLLFAVFAAIAIILATVGLYSVLATTVRQRTAEIGVRMAFGAAPRDVFALMLQHGLALSGIGIAAGIVGALFTARWMSTLLVGVTPSDASTYLSVMALFALVVVLASLVPARRAAHLTPTVALRDD